MKNNFRYFTYKELPVSIRNVYQRGGQFQKAADCVHTILGRIQNQEDDPFKGFDVTHQGETRIPHCVKYDMNGFSRLITIQDSGLCILCYLGNHDECDRWLERNKGLTLTVNNRNELHPVLASRDIGQPDLRIQTETNWDTGKLVSKIPDRYYDRIANGVSRALLVRFEALESINTEEQIMTLACQIDSTEKQNVFFDVFNKLRSGDVDGAKLSVDLYTNNILRLEDLTREKIEEVVESDSFLGAEAAAQLLQYFMKTADYRDWMLFMGQEQKEVVGKDYSGPAKLAGVSGSGKTCVIVKRSIRLAEKYQDANILVLTLNPALAKLIDHLVDYTCFPELRKRIVVRSFWQLCQAELKKFEPERFDQFYTDVTWKRGEHITEIWDEYYDSWKQREFNNRDASVMLPIHRELLTRGVFPKTYIAQEFDWVRSALEPSKRKIYLEVTRKGRHVPFEIPDRELILEGLLSWEKKMRFVGVVDDLGLAIALHKHIDEIKPAYRCVLVDEAQDFGTLELQIVRKLVSESENDIFLCGDVMQRISTKHHSMKAAGIDITGRSKTLKKNYRNSREILTAAYEVLKRHISLGDIQDDDFEILDPEYANFSTPKPLLLKAETPEAELLFSLAYLKQKYNQKSNGQKACIALTGVSFIGVKRIGTALELPVLDGNINMQASTIFLAELSQMKGYEFDSVCILNCASDVLPDPNQPEAESYRDISRLYVAMTRAKQELILSYSGKPTEFLTGCHEFFTSADWKEHSIPDSLIKIDLTELERPKGGKDKLDITGEDFLYTKYAVGLIPRIQEQLLSTVTGIRNITSGRQTEWPTIKELLISARTDRPTAARAFGALKSLDEFEEWLERKELSI